MIDRKSIQGFEYLFFMEEKTMKKFVSIISLVLVAAMLCVSLVSCGAPAKDPADAKAALSENGYVATKDDTVVPGILKIAGFDCTSVVTGTKTVEDDEGNKSVEHVSIYYFADKDAAEKAMTKIEEYASDDKDEAEDSNWVATTQSGAMVYYGTKQAIKDAK